MSPPAPASPAQLLRPGSSGPEARPELAAVGLPLSGLAFPSPGAAKIKDRESRASTGQEEVLGAGSPRSRVGRALPLPGSRCPRACVPPLSHGLSSASSSLRLVAGRSTLHHGTGVPGSTHARLGLGPHTPHTGSSPCYCPPLLQSRPQAHPRIPRLHPRLCPPGVTPVTTCGSEGNQETHLLQTRGLPATAERPARLPGCLRPEPSHQP